MKFEEINTEKKKPIKKQLRNTILPYSSIYPNNRFKVNGFDIIVKYCENREEPDMKLRKWFVEVLIEEGNQYKILPEVYLNAHKYAKPDKFELRLNTNDTVLVDLSKTPKNPIEIIEEFGTK